MSRALTTEQLQKVYSVPAVRKMIMESDIKLQSQLDIALSIPQSDLFVSKAPSVAVIAGLGSGKTFTMWLKLWSWLCEYPGNMFGYFAPTHSLIRDILYPMVEKFCTLRGIPYSINHNHGVIHIHGLGSVICKSMHDPDLIVGFEIMHAAIDEGDLLTVPKMWLAWRKIVARCRINTPDGTPNQVVFGSTPEGYKFAYQAFEKTPLDNSVMYNMSTYTNARNLPKTYIPNLKSSYTDELVDAYLMGLFRNLVSGTVYKAYKRDRNDTNMIVTNKMHLHIGMDFNVRHMAAIVHNIFKGEPYAIAELVQLKDTPQMIEALQERYPKNRITIYPDATGKNPSSCSASGSDIKLLKEAGFYVKANPGNPPVRDRINSMNVGFDGRRGYMYRVNVETCPRYVESLEQQCYTILGTPDKDHDTDHPNDAGGYFMNWCFGVTKPETTTTTVLPH